MAKLGSYYGLCPLIDYKSLLGISKDDEKGTVIVTLGKNISIKHKLSDQKQLHSWRTKDKFTSPVIYDSELSKYLAVFNQTYIRVWTGEEEHLDRLKKLKFCHQIHTLFSCKEKSFVVFKNGNVLSLHTALESRRDLNIQAVIRNDENISDVLYSALGDDVHIGLLIEDSRSYYLLWTVLSTDIQANKYFKVNLERDSLELTGYAFHAEGSCLHFLTLWSDGKMFSNILQNDETSVKLSGELFTATESIDHKQPVSMISLDENYIAMYGADCNGEGATLLIYNVQFKVTQSKQILKLFTKGAKLWCLENNLILPIGQNLAVIPYYLDTEQLAALIGSHTFCGNEEKDDIYVVNELEIAGWGTEDVKKHKEVPEGPYFNISELCKQGLPENAVVESLIPNILVNLDVSRISQVLKCFSDIPEKYLVKFVKSALSAKPDTFKNKIKCKYADLPPQLQPFRRIHLLNTILSKPFSENLTLSVFRSYLNLDDILLFLEYLSFIFSRDGYYLNNLNNVQTEENFVLWASVLLDASFQRLLLTKDDNAITILNKFRGVINEQLESLDTLTEFSVVLREFCKGKTPSKKYGIANHIYSVELINLY